jgi:hypothetical protein
MPLYSATCPLPKKNAGQRKRFPERIRITGPNVDANFVLVDFIPNSLAVYYDDVTNSEFYIDTLGGPSGVNLNLYSANLYRNFGTPTSLNQIPTFSLPTSLSNNNYKTTTQHTTPTLAVSISQLTQSKVYDGPTIPSLSFTSTPSIAFGEYSFSSLPNTPGTYTISLVESNKNSKFIWNGPYPSVSYTITKRPVPLTMVDRSATYSPSGTFFGQVLTGGLAANLPNGQGLISGDAQNTFTGLLQNLPPSNSDVGTYTVSINPNYPEHPLYTISGYTGNKTTATVTINKATPTISFSPSTSATSGTSVTLVASTSPASLPVTFSIVSGGSSANISGGNTLNFTGAGTVVLRASTASTTNYNAATSVDRTITVAAPPSDGIPARITTLSEPGGSFFGKIETAKEYTSWEPATGSNIGDAYSTTAINSSTASSDSFTSYLSKTVQTYNGNRDLRYIILNPRHRLSAFGGSPKVPYWSALWLEVSYDAENGDSYSAGVFSTNPSADPLNFPTSGWTNGFQPHVQLARDINISITNFYDLSNLTTQTTDPYGGYYSGTTPRVRVLQKQNRTPGIRDKANSFTDSLWNNFQPVSIRGGRRMPAFYALLGYMYTEEPNIPWGGTRQLIFGYTHEFFGWGWPLTKALPPSSPVVSSDYDIGTLKNVWVLTMSGTYSHGDGSGGGFDAGSYYNVPSNTNPNVLPPALSPLTSPSWRMVGNHSSGFFRPHITAYTPNYSDTPVADIITASGAPSAFLNSEWVRINVGDAVNTGNGNSQALFLKSGTAYMDLVGGYLLLAPNSTLADSPLDGTTNFPLSAGPTLYTCPSNEWQVVTHSYNSDYVVFDVTAYYKAQSSNVNRIPQTLTGFNGQSGSISFAPKSFY